MGSWVWSWSCEVQSQDGGKGCQRRDHANFMKFNRAKGKVLQLGQSNLKNTYRVSDQVFLLLAPSMHHHLLCFSD